MPLSEQDDEETAVTYCHMVIPGFCSGRFNASHNQHCAGGYEIPRGPFAWIGYQGPLRCLEVERERERDENDWAMRWLDNRDCQNMNAYGLRDIDGGDFNYGRGR